MKLGSEHVIPNDHAFKLYEAMKRALAGVEYESINIYTEYEIDFWREKVEVDVVLKDFTHIRHIETVMVPDLHIDQNGSLLCMIAEFEHKFTQDSRRILMESKPLILNHIRFLSDDKPLCHWPARLGHDQVYNTPTLLETERPCKECQELLLVFQLRSKLSENPYSVAYIQDTYQNPLKTILLTGLITSAIWIVILVMFFIVVGK